MNPPSTVRKMIKLLLLTIAWVSLLYRYNWFSMNWIDVQNILPCMPEFRGEALNIARKLTRVFCFFYLVWHVVCKFIFQFQFRMLLERVTYVMDHYKVPKPLQDRILQCYKQAWSTNKIKFPLPKLGLYILPKVLYYVLIAHIGKTLLDKLKMYQQCFRLLTSIAPKVHVKSYSSGDIVFRKGSVADKIYLVAAGILAATTDTGEQLETMSSGDIVGEIGALHIDGYNVRTANVHSVTDSEVFEVHQKDVNKIINKFPDAKKMMVDIGKKRLLHSKTLPS